jgi:hypothetical protein
MTSQFTCIWVFLFSLPRCTVLARKLKAQLRYVYNNQCLDALLEVGVTFIFCIVLDIFATLLLQKFLFSLYLSSYPSNMDFEKIKQNLRYRSGRTSRNMSKRFPTRDREAIPVEPPAPTPQQQKVSLTTRQSLPPAAKSKPTHRHNPSPVIIGDSKTAPREQDTEQVASPAIPKAHPSSSDSENYEFPPSAITKSVSLEDLSKDLYSEGYLHTLTNDPQLLGRFSAFLNKYRPDIAHLVARYLEIQKVIKAVRYANAVAISIEQLGQPNQPSEIKKFSPVAELSAKFHQSSQDVFKTLLSIGRTYSHTKFLYFNREPRSLRAVSRANTTPLSDFRLLTPLPGSRLSQEILPNYSANSFDSPSSMGDLFFGENIYVLPHV